jgi:hypothetical protein
MNHRASFRRNALPASPCLRCGECPESFPRWSAGHFLFEKKVAKENTQVQFKSAAGPVTGIFRQDILVLSKNDGLPVRRPPGLRFHTKSRSLNAPDN